MLIDSQCPFARIDPRSCSDRFPPDSWLHQVWHDNRSLHCWREFPQLDRRLSLRPWFQFGGHGLIPNLIADMKQPEYVDQMCDTSYGIVMVIYLVVAVFGYLMYGRNVSDQVSKDLARTPGFTPLLNKLAVWTTAVNALCKVPLGNQPVSPFFALGPLKRPH